MLVEALQKPFESRDIEWRIGRSGQKKDGGVWASALAYLTNRAIMSRLDEVFGPGGWRNEFKEWRVGEACGVLCGLTLKVDGEWITKWDGAGNTDFEPVKGGLSDSMKRAAVQWGIGRYLYDLEENFVEVSSEKRSGWKYAQTKEKVAFYWKPPELPSWALPTKPAAPPVSTRITPEEIKVVASKLKSTNITEADFLVWVSKAAKFQVKAIADIPKSVYARVIVMLDAEAIKVSA